MTSPQRTAARDRSFANHGEPEGLYVAACNDADDQALMCPSSSEVRPRWRGWPIFCPGTVSAERMNAHDRAYRMLPTEPANMPAADVRLQEIERLGLVLSDVDARLHSETVTDMGAALLE